jgi:hypothetical protein
MIRAPTGRSFLLVFFIVPKARLGQLPKARLGQLPKARLGQLPKARLGQLPKARLRHAKEVLPLAFFI